MRDTSSSKSPEVVTFGDLYRALRDKSDGSTMTLPTWEDGMAFRNLGRYVFDRLEVGRWSLRAYDFLASLVVKTTNKYPDEIPRLSLVEVWRIVEAAAVEQPKARDRWMLADFQNPAREYLEKHASPNHRVTARELAQHLKILNPARTCSVDTVQKLAAWRAYQAGLPEEQRRTPGRKPKTVSYTSKVEAVAGKNDAELERLIGEQESDSEPSPLEEDFPDKQPRKVVSYRN